MPPIHRWDTTGSVKLSGKTDNAFAMVERPLAMAEDVEFLTKFVEEQQLTTPEDVEEWRPPHIAGRPNRPFGLPARGI